MEPEQQVLGVVWVLVRLLIVVAVAEDVKPGFGMHIDQRNDAYLQFYEQLLTHCEPSG